ncbi:hypothetical protein AFI02nite_39120 [Aliivibrio fischeri]|nr:hypothetical protein AFI02nite_39120 [Aliivibrio fischeri]
MGFPADEVIPALIVFGVLFAAGYMLTGMLFSGVITLGLRTIKQGQGNNFLRLTAYWFSPASLSKSVFKHTPPPCDKYWLN